MKSSLLVLVFTLCASVALAEPPPSAPSNKTQEAAAALVNKQLLMPLQKAESKRSRFSRAAVVPVQRRVRVLDALTLTDLRGKQFVRFAIDERRARDEQGAWKEGSVGCAYLSEREVFVRRGEAYLPAGSVLGQDKAQQPGVCRAAPEGTVQVANSGEQQRKAGS